MEWINSLDEKPDFVNPIMVIIAGKKHIAHIEKDIYNEPHYCVGKDSRCHYCTGISEVNFDICIDSTSYPEFASKWKYLEE